MAHDSVYAVLTIGPFPTFTASFTNNVSIETSNERPTAGENYTLTCTVMSDRPPIMKWIGLEGNDVSGEGVIVHSQFISGFNSTLLLEFLPLRTSHGGIYMCVSSISTSPSAHDSQLVHTIGVQSKHQSNDLLLSIETCIP